MSHRVTLKKNTISVFFGCGVSIREIIWARHMLCRIFRPIDCFSGVIQDLGPFLESPFWPVTRKRLIFEIWFRFWAPFFFNFLSDGLFWGLRFFENFSYYCNSFTPFFWIWRGQKKYICFGKNRCYC